jgi:hypothetical protein
MSVRQLSVFIENRAGRVSHITEVLESAGISIRGFSLADTGDFGIARLVVDEPNSAQRALERAGFLVRVGDVLCIALPDRPGELNHIFCTVASIGIDVEYAYSLVSTYVVLKVDDVLAAEKLLTAESVYLVDQEELSDLTLQEN